MWRYFIFLRSIVSSLLWYFFYCLICLSCILLSWNLDFHDTDWFRCRIYMNFLCKFNSFSVFLFGLWNLRCIFFLFPISWWSNFFIHIICWRFLGAIIKFPFWSFCFVHTSLPQRRFIDPLNFILSNMLLQCHPVFFNIDFKIQFIVICKFLHRCFSKSYAKCTKLNHTLKSAFYLIGGKFEVLKFVLLNGIILLYPTSIWNWTIKV